MRKMKQERLNMTADLPEVRKEEKRTVGEYR
jgi:hypothetical protein